jgi:CarD family transcriptional regulator
MLEIGDKVVYPMHGAGVIEAVEEHEVLGLRQSYYILTMPYGGMRVMIPLKNADSIGLREVIGEPEVPKVIDVLRTAPVQTNANWNRRFNANLSKIKSGNIFEVAEVVRNLMLQDRIKKLSTGERRLLDTARQILVSELVLACNKDLFSVETWIDGLLQENTPGN